MMDKLLNNIPKQDQLCQYTVLITTSGIGSRLGNLSQVTNKSLIVLGQKPVIAHIVESYPENTEYIVTLGHFGEHIKEFLEIAYPKRNFTFVQVFPFEGSSSSLALSISFTKN